MASWIAAEEVYPALGSGGTTGWGRASMLKVWETVSTTLPSSEVRLAVTTWSPAVGVQKAETVCVAPTASVAAGEPSLAPSTERLTTPEKAVALSFETMAYTRTRWPSVTGLLERKSGCSTNPAAKALNGRHRRQRQTRIFFTKKV